MGRRFDVRYHIIQWARAYVPPLSSGILCDRADSCVFLRCAALNYFSGGSANLCLTWKLSFCSPSAYFGYANSHLAVGHGALFYIRYSITILMIFPFLALLHSNATSYTVHPSTLHTTTHHNQSIHFPSNVLYSVFFVQWIAAPVSSVCPSGSEDWFTNQMGIALACSNNSHHRPFARVATIIVLPPRGSLSCSLPANFSSRLLCRHTGEGADPIVRVLANVLSLASYLLLCHRSSVRPCSTPCSGLRIHPQHSSSHCVPRGAERTPWLSFVRSPFLRV